VSARELVRKKDDARRVKLRARWLGPLPRIGEYLMSEMRPRHAYRIEQVTAASPSVHWDPATKTEVHLLQVVAARVAKTEVPGDARIHPWRWDRREAHHSLRMSSEHAACKKVNKELWP
jgi:hypothetical protein